MYSIGPKWRSAIKHKAKYSARRRNQEKASTYTHDCDSRLSATISSEQLATLEAGRGDLLFSQLTSTLAEVGAERAANATEGDVGFPAITSALGVPSTACNQIGCLGVGSK